MALAAKIKSNKSKKIKLALTSFLVFAFALIGFTPQAGADDSKIVKIGVYVNQIRDVDLKSQTFSADVYVWFKWTNSALNPDRTFEFMNAFDPSSGQIKKSFPEPLEISKGVYYQVNRYQGRFSSNISLRSYPFDKQTLKVIIEDNALTTADLIYLLDDKAISINQDLKLPGYQISSPDITIQNQRYPTDFGYKVSDVVDNYSRATISFDIERPILPYLLKLIFPILLVIMVAALAFWIDPFEVEARVGMVVTALLTLVALQITTNSNLPEVEYLMLIDLLYNLSFAFVLAVMIDVVITTGLHKKGEDAAALRFGNKMRLAAFTIYSVAIVLALVNFQAI